MGIHPRFVTGAMLLAVVAVSITALAQNAEKRSLVTLTAAQLKGGVVSEVTWDGETIVLQGVHGNPDGSLVPQYWATPIDKGSLTPQPNHTDASAKYWTMKSATTSPDGAGASIAIASDSSMPMYGIGGLGQRVNDGVDMGGTQKRHTVRLGTVVLYERAGGPPPYDGEVWSWSPVDLGRIAYVDKNGDLWIARTDGSARTRLAKGNFSLPAWSPNGKHIAVAELKDPGPKATWEISSVGIPDRLLK